MVSWKWTGLVAVAVFAAAGLTVVALRDSGRDHGPAAPTATVAIAQSPVRLLPIVSSSPASDWYPADTVFQMTDVFDLQRIPAIDTANWPQVVTPDGALSVRFPPLWMAKAGRVSESSLVQVRKPLPPGQVVGECRTLPGYVLADLNADTFPITAESAGATIVRDVLAQMPTNGMTVRMIQAANICGADGGVISLVGQPPFHGELFLNGAVSVQFPATAQDIATALAIIGSVTMK